jgi:uncharacterized protein
VEHYAASSEFVLSDVVMSDYNCQGCGACCAAYRVDFALAELEEPGREPLLGLAAPINGHTCRMRGTDYANPRCGALQGAIGESVTCAVYEWRPAPCRELESGSLACERARAMHGLA